jgi:hypothetical protein
VSPPFSKLGLKVSPKGWYQSARVKAPETGALRTSHQPQSEMFCIAEIVCLPSRSLKLDGTTGDVPTEILDCTRVLLCFEQNTSKHIKHR